jgi:hypothetical protein
MSTNSGLIASLGAWIGVWCFWLMTTRGFHPTFWLAIVVTTSLTLAFALVVYANHLLLIPQLWSTGRRMHYALSLGLLMMVMTALALAVIRFTYTSALGPDPDQNGVYKHFAIDLFGMAVHVSLAAVVVAIVKRVERWYYPRSGTNGSP